MYSMTARSRPRGSAVPAALKPAGCHDVPEQVDGQDVGQGLGGKRSPGAAACQLGAHRRHCRPKVGELQAVQWRDRQPRRIEVERLGGHPPDQPRLQVDAEQVPAAAPAPPGRAAGRHQHDRAGGGRPVPPHPLVPQVQLLRRPNEQTEPVVGQGGLVEFKGALRSAAHRLQADPPQPVAPGGRLERDGLEPVQGPDRAAVYRFLLWHQLCLPDDSGLLRPCVAGTPHQLRHAGRCCEMQPRSQCKSRVARDRWSSQGLRMPGQAVDPHLVSRATSDA